MRVHDLIRGSLGVRFLNDIGTDPAFARNMKPSAWAAGVFTKTDVIHRHNLNWQAALPPERPLNDL